MQLSLIWQVELQLVPITERNTAMPALKKKGCVCGYRYKKHFLYLFVFMFQLTKTRSFRYFDRHLLFNRKIKKTGNRLWRQSIFSPHGFRLWRQTTRRLNTQWRWRKSVSIIQANIIVSFSKQHDDDNKKVLP